MLSSYSNQAQRTCTHKTVHKPPKICRLVAPEAILRPKFDKHQPLWVKFGGVALWGQYFANVQVWPNMAKCWSMFGQLRPTFGHVRPKLAEVRHVFSPKSNHLDTSAKFGRNWDEARLPKQRFDNCVAPFRPFLAVAGGRSPSPKPRRPVPARCAQSVACIARASYHFLFFFTATAASDILAHDSVARSVTSTTPANNHGPWRGRPAHGSFLCSSMLRASSGNRDPSHAADVPHTPASAQRSALRAATVRQSPKLRLRLTHALQAPATPQGLRRSHGLC